MTKIEREERTVRQMIALYCRHKEGNRQLCAQCRELMEYSAIRLHSCKFGENKASCRRCPVHCYKPEMRNRIREVMRWAGPRMVLYHPIAAMRHVLEGINTKSTSGSNPG